MASFVSPAFFCAVLPANQHQHRVRRGTHSVNKRQTATVDILQSQVDREQMEHGNSKEACSTARSAAEAGSHPDTQHTYTQHKFPEVPILTGILGGVTSRARSVLGLVASVLVAGLLLGLAHHGVLQARNNARMSVQLFKSCNTQMAMHTPPRTSERALADGHDIFRGNSKAVRRRTLASLALSPM
jgi:type II secretory pathway component PulL